MLTAFLFTLLLSYLFISCASLPGNKDSGKVTYAYKTVEITAGDYTLRAGTSKVTFDGFLKLYNDAEEEEQVDPGIKIIGLDIHFNFT